MNSVRVHKLVKTLCFETKCDCGVVTFGVIASGVIPSDVIASGVLGSAIFQIRGRYRQNSESRSCDSSEFVDACVAEVRVLLKRRLYVAVETWGH